MTTPAPTVWHVDAITSVTDGDTLRIRRSRIVDIDGRHYRLSDHHPRGVPIRLAWVDTPEYRHDPEAAARARADLQHWIELHEFAHEPLTVICYESAGWDRLLGDLIDSHGNSASQFLMGDRGWPPYNGGKA